MPELRYQQSCKEYVISGIAHTAAKLVTISYCILHLATIIWTELPFLPLVSLQPTSKVSAGQQYFCKIL